MNFFARIKTISIIGVGLIGGSIGLALKRRAKSKEQKVIGIGRHKEKLIKAKKLGAIDEYTTDFEKGVRDADLVVIATPVETIVPIAKRILPFLKKDCIITDVGSVKLPIVSAAERFLSQSPIIHASSAMPPRQVAEEETGRRHSSSDILIGVPPKRWEVHRRGGRGDTHHSPLSFVGGHPLAGSEKSGIDNARTDLFHGAVCFLTPTKKTSLKTLEVVRKFWQLLGTKVFFLSPQLHDYLLARSSHLPHLLAASLVNLIAENRSEYSAQVLGPSFRDLTRIASSEPEIWTEISLFNRKQIIRAMQRFRNIILEMENLLKKKERKKIIKFFEKAKNYREKIFNGRTH